jgi:P-type Ca2+ transporter type 2C
MGNATTVCSDKTGTLTMNQMKVVSGLFGLSSRFVEQGNGPSHPDISNSSLDAPAEGSAHTRPDAQEAMSAKAFAATLPSTVRDILVGSIAINSTAFEGEEDGRPVYIGSKTEAAILDFAKDYLGMRPIHIERANADMVDVCPFSSTRKCMATIVRLEDNRYRMYVKGAPEVLLERSNQIIRDCSGLEDATHDLNEDDRDSLLGAVATYADQALRTLGFAYKDLDVWPPPEDSNPELNLDDVFDLVTCDLTFLGIVGIQDPPRPGVREAVSQCQHAGVFVRMVTGDNVHTAKAIARQVGILTDSGVVLEGPDFRRMPSDTLRKMLPQLQVLARSSPEDKKTLVQLLKEEGEIVAVTGDGTNDGPALRMANVGFAMGISGTEVAKEASAIVLMDDNFSSIVKAIKWGRGLNDVIKKFLRVSYP